MPGKSRIWGEPSTWGSIAVAIVLDNSLTGCGAGSKTQCDSLFNRLLAILRSITVARIVR